MKPSKWIIKDWCGNECFHSIEFYSFEDAWGYIYDVYRHLTEREFDDQMSEFEVVEV